MWSRLLRALTALLNAYNFYTNPVRFLFTLLCITVLPYLAYIFLGGVAFVLLLGLAGYLFYRGYEKNRAKSS